MEIKPWECRWESNVDDTWTFFLVHDHIRLTVRVPDRYRNVQLEGVPDECPLIHVEFEIVPGAKKSTAMCLHYAVEAMRVGLPHVSTLGDLPMLVENCSDVARLANEWVLSVHRDFYNLDYKGAPHQLVFKVANYSYNCEWTVTMNIKKWVDEKSQDVFPVVDHVQVTSETQGVPEVTNSRQLSILRRRVRRNWGHVPTTLWRVFKYLKYMKKIPVQQSST